MNTSSSVLWQLIRSMNRNEKLFFNRKFADGGIKNSLYKKLYDVIASQKKYNEEEILTRLAPAINKKNIAFQKHYLHSLLNECLVGYSNRNNVEQQIFKNIQLIRLNRKKGLLNEALALWEKTMNKARKAELFAMIQLLKREFEKMILLSSVQVRYDNLHTLFSSNIMTYNEYAEMITLRDLYTEVIMLKRKAHFDFDEILTNEINSLLKKFKVRQPGLQSRSFWYRHYTRMCHATLFYLTNKIDKCLSLVKDGVEDWWDNKRFIESDAEHYIELLYMVNYAGVRHGSYPYVEMVFNNVINRLIEDDVQVAHFEALKYLALNKVYHKTARYDEVAKLVEHMKVKYTKWELLLNAELNRTLCFSLGISCFVLDNYNESLQYIKRGVTYFKDGTREEQLIFANLFLLLVLFNMNNTKMFDAQYKSTYIYFYKKSRPKGSPAKKQTRSFEKILMHCFHDGFYLNGYKERAKLFQNAIVELEQNKDNEVQKQTLSIFNFQGWLLSQVQRIHYRQYVLNKNLGGGKVKKQGSKDSLIVIAP